jgi:hypothetical protein
VASFVSRVSERVGRYAFNLANAYYVRDGRRVSGDTLAAVRAGRVDDAVQTARNLTDAYLAGRIGIGDWRDAFAVELRRAHSQVYALGRGGWEGMTAADREAVAARLRSEFDYLRQFARDVPSLSDAEIAQRMDLYANHVTASFWEGQTAAKTEAGFTEEMRTLGATDKHCADCPGYADHWEPIGTLPEPGDACECGANCQCSKSYR